MKKFRCPDCGRVYSCPVCGRAYKSASHAAKCMTKARKVKETPYCAKCKKSFGIAVSDAMPKDARDYVMSSIILP